jgi:uncharacterized protein YndB with AHSA1/START domain
MPFDSACARVHHRYVSAPNAARTIRLITDLDASADRVWEAVTTPAAFRLVTRGLISMPGLRHRNDPWREGETVSSWLLLFGIVPFSRHHLTFVEIDERRRLLRSKEHGGLVRRWEHDITVTPLSAGRCRYEDRVTIGAGRLTGVISAWALVFYKLRQRRWRELAHALGA